MPVDLESMPEAEALEHVKRVLASHEYLLKAAKATCNALGRLNESSHPGSYDAYKTAETALIEADLEECVGRYAELGEVPAIEFLSESEALEYLKTALASHDALIEAAKATIEYVGPRSLGEQAELAYIHAERALEKAGQAKWVTDRLDRLLGRPATH